MLNYDQRVACLRQAIKSLETADVLQQRALSEQGELTACNSENIRAMINSLKADIESLDPDND